MGSDKMDMLFIKPPKGGTPDKKHLNPSLKHLLLEAKMQEPSKTEAPPRLASIDAFRGFVMLLMIAEKLQLREIGEKTGSKFWSALGWLQTHVQWTGCSLHDLIQPSFSFLVGTALPFSIANRQARGESFGKMLGHTLWRAFLLVALGIFLRSVNRTQTNFTFEDTLTQIGLGYPFLFLLGFRPMRDRWIALAVILGGYWVAFALYPLPPADFDYAKVLVPQEWLQQHRFEGFAAHWNKNSNAAWAFDTWFLNLFPREKPFVANGGGYATLSFIPTLGTMILGLIAGAVLRGEKTAQSKINWLLIAGVAGVFCGWLLGALGICPVVKRIWTPSWTLFSGGLAFLILAGFYWVMDVRQRRTWAFPLLVVGMNSIAAYMIAHLFVPFLSAALKCHLPDSFFMMFGKPYDILILNGCVTLTLWLILLWMFRRKIFLKV